jgi:hypothetical protein
LSGWMPGWRRRGWDRTSWASNNFRGVTPRKDTTIIWIRQGFIKNFILTSEHIDKKKPAEYGRLLAEYISTFILFPVSAWQPRCQDR